jgi:hypothetical protein
MRTMINSTPSKQGANLASASAKNICLNKGKDRSTTAKETMVTLHAGVVQSRHTLRHSGRSPWPAPLLLFLFHRNEHASQTQVKWSKHETLFGC